MFFDPSLLNEGLIFEGFFLVGSLFPYGLGIFFCGLGALVFQIECPGCFQLIDGISCATFLRSLFGPPQFLPLKDDPLYTCPLFVRFLCTNLPFPPPEYNHHFAMAAGPPMSVQKFPRPFNFYYPPSALSKIL